MAQISTAAVSAAANTLIDSVNGAATKKSAGASSEAQDRFLKLLTTQLKNQDPLNPMDNAQMTSQLAQISTVDGIEKMNATLQKMLSSSADDEALRAAALVGHQVMVQGSGLNLTASGAAGGLELSAAADHVVVTISDSNGLPVQSIDLGNLSAGPHNFAWDGKTDSGANAVKGDYKVSIVATRGAEKVEVSALQLTEVMSVKRSTQGVALDLGKYGLAAISDVKQIF